MFDEMNDYLQGLNGKKLEVPIRADTDEDGYLDRECPAEDCLFRFKVHIDDWTNKTDKAAVHCAFCGHVADDKKWFTADMSASHTLNFGALQRRYSLRDRPQYLSSGIKRIPCEC